MQISWNALCGITWDERFLVPSYIFSSLDEGSDDESFREAGAGSNVDRRVLEASRINKSRPARADLKLLSSVRIERGENSMLLPPIYYPRPGEPW